MYFAIGFFAVATFILSALSQTFERRGVPALLLALVAGIVAGPYVTNLVDAPGLDLDSPRFLREVARVTLAVTLLGVALRLPRGYWKANIRWVIASIAVGMPVMFAVASGVTLLLGVSFLTALLIAAAITPTDPVVTTPIVTGKLSEERIPTRVRLNISSESGLNDGLGYLFLMLPVLLTTRSAEAAWSYWSTMTLLWEIAFPVAIGLVAGLAAGALFNRAVARGWTSAPSYLGYGLAFAVAILAILHALETDALLGVFVAGAMFADRLHDDLRESLGRQFDALSRVAVLPVFVLLGCALPIADWLDLGPAAALVLALALIGRRLVSVWVTRPIYAPLHSRSETAFLSWFGPVGVSALFYACVAEQETADPVVFPAVTLTIALSVLVHGVSATPAALWLKRRESARADERRVA